MKDKKAHWDIPISPQAEEELDLELIEELNDEYEKLEGETKAEESFSDKKEKSKLLLIKLTGTITVLFFIAFLLGNWLHVFSLPSLDFLKESKELARKPKIKQLQRAVVKIDSMGRRGTGFNIREDGLILTNNHIIEGGKTAQINFLNNKTYVGKVVNSYPEIDIAVVDIEAEKLPVANLEGKRRLQKGAKVIIIGNPLGFSKVIQEGEITGQIKLKDWKKPVWLIKGTIHKGNSGSPVYNETGQVVAVIFATLSASQDSKEIIGLAVPIEYIKEKLEEN